MNQNMEVANQRADSETQREQDVSHRTTVLPPVDIIENPHAITLWADLPGVSRERLDLRVQDGGLTIEGEATVPVPQKLRLSHAEVRVPYFSRRFSVCDDFDTSRIEALLKNGVLKLTIPRREEAKPRKIEVSLV